MSICTQAQALSAYTPQQVSSDEIGIGEDERRCLNEAAACNRKCGQGVVVRGGAQQVHGTVATAAR